MSEIVNLSPARTVSLREARRAEQLRAALPPITTKRWVASRKAAVVAAVNHGILDESDVFQRYGIGAEELSCWRTSLEKHGVSGLRATRTQDDRGS